MKNSRHGRAVRGGRFLFIRSGERRMPKTKAVREMEGKREKYKKICEKISEIGEKGIVFDRKFMYNICIVVERGGK